VNQLVTYGYDGMCIVWKSLQPPPPPNLTELDPAELVSTKAFPPLQQPLNYSESVHAKSVDAKASIPLQQPLNQSELVSNKTSAILERLDTIESVLCTLVKKIDQLRMEPVDHPTQGNLLEVVTSEEAEETSAVTIQHYGSGRYVYHVDSTLDWLPCAHFTLKELTEEQAKEDPSAHFILTHLEGEDLVTLTSAQYGEVLSMQKHAIHPKGYVATVVEAEEDATPLKYVQDEHVARFVGPRRQHLRRVTVQDPHGQPYDIVATQSILAEADGLFTLNTLRA
jgi:hypothetical protein